MVPCSGSSMLPSLAIDGDVIIHSPMAYWRSLVPWGPRFVMPQRGELVVAVNPNEFRGTVCKRVVGLPGDIVEYDPRRVEADKRKEKGLTFVKVPKGHVWLSGDNMSNSTDSRDYGPMPIAMIRGKVIRVVSCGQASSGPVPLTLQISGFSFKQPLVTTVTELGPSPEPPRLNGRKPQAV
ncbi:hypothetical protein VHUM_03850 [Vanrija humicola]|uniref:Peptidase S26 domain-containing protein n=1 Tax=Vanrija humicola TaxID=5417 RepID=A0A7D8UWV9_VANHU|nr:hypothetical protein VHUM_03850 [Vanrija humicola]